MYNIYYGLKVVRTKHTFLWIILKFRIMILLCKISKNSSYLKILISLIDLIYEKKYIKNILSRYILSDVAVSIKISFFYYFNQIWREYAKSKS